jgi:hypothetical protein
LLGGSGLNNLLHHLRSPFDVLYELIGSTLSINDSKSNTIKLIVSQSSDNIAKEA